MSPAIAADHADPAVVVTDDFEHKRQEMQRVAKDCVVVVDNLPKIGSDKYERLVSRLTPRFEVAALRRNEAGEPRVTFVRDEEGSTLGFAFAEYLTPEDAHRAVGLLHNLQLDRNHTFWAITAGDLEQLQEMPVEFVPPPAIPVTTKDRPDFRSWLLDERGRDQFMIRHDDKASIYWHDHAVKPQLVRFAFNLTLSPFIHCALLACCSCANRNDEFPQRVDIFLGWALKDVHTWPRLCGISQCRGCF